MESWPINPIDGAVLILLLASAMLAFFRGFVHEVLGIIGWIGATIGALLLYPYIQPWTRSWVDMTLVADGLAIGGSFLILLLLLSFISHRIAKLVQQSAASAIDRSLGFIFGLLRGWAFASLIFLLFVWILPPSDHPSYVREARTRPLLEVGALVLIKLLPPGSIADPNEFLGRKPPPDPTQGLRPTHRFLMPTGNAP